MLNRLRDLVEFDAAAVLLYEDSDETWAPVRRTGKPITDTLTTGALPAPLARAMRAGGALIVQPLDGTGLSDGSASGLYASLRARGALIGLLAIETSRPERYTAKDVELVNGLLEPFGVAIDNARMFSRLRTMGADEERSRIARDLHDRIGQSLAHLGFELDRAVRATERGTDPRPILDDVRGQVRSVTTEVRETLYDLRTDVTANQDVVATMALFLDRVRARSGLQIELVQQATGRLPLMYERELWRIAKEAVVNAERHARAERLHIVWRSDGRAAELTVTDDGQGFVRHAARADSYGIIGMRERATSIGARFEIESTAHGGTTVRVVVGGPPRSERRS
jgi:signal transduction histidine kinase